MQGGHPAGLCCPQNQTQCLLHIWHCSWSEGKATAQEIRGCLGSRRSEGVVCMLHSWHIHVSVASMLHWCWLQLCDCIC